MSDRPQDVIRRAIQRISVPGQWTQNAWARDKGGHATDCHSEKAVSWCAVGAIMRESGSPRETEATLQLINRATPAEPLGLSATNDTYATNERAIAMMRAALADQT